MTTNFKDAKIRYANDEKVKEKESKKSIQKNFKNFKKKVLTKKRMCAKINHADDEKS